MDGTCVNPLAFIVLLILVTIAAEKHKIYSLSGKIIVEERTL